MHARSHSQEGGASLFLFPQLDMSHILFVLQSLSGCSSEAECGCGCKNIHQKPMWKSTSLFLHPKHICLTASLFLHLPLFLSLVTSVNTMVGAIKQKFSVSFSPKDYFESVGALISWF